MASSSITIPTMRTPIHRSRSKFLGQTHQFSTANQSIFPPPKQQSKVYQVKAMGKFNLWEVMGGRGLCNGEKGIEKELKRNIEDEQETSKAENETEKESDDSNLSFKVPEDGFDKEMMGLTGGFPGGEKGLQTFIEKNPPPPPLPPPAKRGTDASAVATDKKPKAPELPLLMPGMIAIVKNQNSPYHMYCGIVQRITDGKAGVLFEGGNWDRLITFRLEELERREKGPPGKNPKSCILEPLIEQMQKEEAAP
ncbi:NADH dehydrogenase-like complex subunit S [Arabidopsis thaliana x Arabidopsis arenosa]|uniref:NADH dehydrogenase-like complex subunit S n=1 Tax=Arabidopsis thaliana x Arabidopsis arenosa TaxID=1240361 RepID=A0A8T1Y3L3_9BRAS|nr:NADH dehydrogenase-like complex subunit S [Arabidopsis thaliana x Arabidopsis arenosa]